MAVRVVRLGSERLPNEGLRIGTVRRPPRGVPKAEFAKRHGVKHGVASNSCTTAIHAALIGTGISPGDEVIVTPVTDMGSIVPILWQGAVPVFADLHPVPPT